MYNNKQELKKYKIHCVCIAHVERIETRDKKTHLIFNDSIVKIWKIQLN